MEVYLYEPFNSEYNKKFVDSQLNLKDVSIFDIMNKNFQIMKKILMLGYGLTKLYLILILNLKFNL